MTKPQAAQGEKGHVHGMGCHHQIFGNCLKAWIAQFILIHFC